MSDVCCCLFSILLANFQTWKPSPPLQNKDMQHRNDRDALSTADNTLTLLLLLLLLLLLVVIVVIVLAIAVVISVRVLRTIFAP